MDMIDRSFLLGEVNYCLDKISLRHNLKPEFIQHIRENVEMFSLFIDSKNIEEIILVSYICWLNGWNAGVNNTCGHWEKAMAKTNAKKVLYETIQETNKDIGKLPGWGFVIFAIALFAVLGWTYYLAMTL